MYNLPVYCTLIQYLQTDWPRHAGKGESDRKIVISTVSIYCPYEEKQSVHMNVYCAYTASVA